jgi:hypothetical protein
MQFHAHLADLHRRRIYPAVITIKITDLGLLMWVGLGFWGLA